MSLIEAAKRRTFARRRMTGATKGLIFQVTYFLSGVIISRGAMLGAMSPFGASFCAAIPFSYLPAGVLGTAVSYLFLSPERYWRR